MFVCEVHNEDHPQGVGLLHPKLSYEIVGAAFEVFNKLGSGLKEQTYQKAFAEELRKCDINFQEQVRIPVKYGTKLVGCSYLDFVIEDTVIVELKRGNYFHRGNIDQVIQYLTLTEFELAILLNFTSSGVQQKRVIHPKYFPPCS